MADHTNQQIGHTFLTRNHDISGLTRKPGMTTSIISAFPQNNMPNAKGNVSGRAGTVFGGVLTILAIMIGSGVVGIPYAAYKLGLILGLGVLYLGIVLGIQSVDLLYESSRMTGWNSLSEIGFIWLGKPSVYIINLVVFTKSFGMPIIYLILTGTCFAQIAEKIDGSPNFLRHRQPYIGVVALILAYFVLKKDITDLKPIAFFLFMGVLGFITLLGIHMIFEQSKTWNTDEHPHKEYFFPFNEKQSKLRLIYMCTTILVGVSFQTVFFPVLNNLKDNSKKNLMKTAGISMSIAGLIYTGCIFISIYAFGHNVHSDILKNVGENSGWETYILGGLFGVVGALHIPLIFFVAKEALLIMVFTFFYTETEKGEHEDGQDTSHLLVEDVSQISKLLPTKSELGGDDEIPTRSQLNHTVLRKTTVIPNIDVSITKQVLAFNNNLRTGGNKDYEKELEAAEGVAREPSHRDLPLVLYLSLTLVIFALDVALAWVLDDVSIVFGFVGALAISMLFFILPGSFYIRSCSLSGEKGSLFRKCVAWFYVIFGFMVMFGGLTSVVVKIVEDDIHDADVPPEE